MGKTECFSLGSICSKEQGLSNRETNASDPNHGPTILERGSKLGSCLAPLDITSGVGLINRETGSLEETAYEGIAELPKTKWCQKEQDMSNG